MMTEIELREAASNLYDGGWRVSDAEEIKKEYGLSIYELEIVLEALQDFETNERNTAVNSHIATLN